MVDFSQHKHICEENKTQADSEMIVHVFDCANVIDGGNVSLLINF